MKEAIIDLVKRIDIIKVSISVTMMGSFFMIVVALISKVIPMDNKDILIHSLGIIEGVLISIATYYFGSSSGSKEKSEQIAEMAKDKK